MSYIKISGQSNLLEVSRETAKIIKAAYDDKFVSGETIITVSPLLSLKKRSINGVWLDDETPDKRSEEFIKKVKATNEKWFTDVRRSSHEKALDGVSYFSLWFKTLKNKEPNSDEKDVAVGLMEQWYKENTNRNFPDPRLFNEIVGELEENTEKNVGNFIPITFLLRKGMIEIFGKILANDLQMSKRFNIENEETTRSQELDMKKIAELF